MLSEIPERPVNANRKNALVAKKALLRLLEPLAGFVLDSGLSVQELQSAFREAAVRSVASRQLEVARRVNISGIAASTGISRAEISRILKSRPNLAEGSGRERQSTNRVLAVWHQDPRFSGANGQPADLKIYGRGATFDNLVKTYGRGIPTRAMLDELLRTGAAELLSGQIVRVKTSVTLDRGMSAQVIRSFGERASDLLSTMLQNMRNPEGSRFIASISGSNVSPDVLPLFRKELSGKGADFLANMQDLLFRGPVRARNAGRTIRSSRVSVTVFYHESARSMKQNQSAPKKRTNLRREE